MHTMKHTSYLLLFWFFFVTAGSDAQTVKLGSYEFEAVSASVSNETLMNKQAIKVIKDSSVQKVDEPTF